MIQNTVSYKCYAYFLCCRDSAFAYLCGHLHTLFGLAKKMYFLQPQGYWEWELGDWRENR